MTLTTRREFVQAGMTLLGAGRSVAGAAAASDTSNGYTRLLQRWCRGLIRHQLVGATGVASAGGLLCPACSMIHGRSPDAIHPLLSAASLSGEHGHIESAIRLFDWGERNVSCSDGSWVNDTAISDWRGITVFRATAIAESLRHHADLLPSGVRSRWLARLSRALKFLDGFMSIGTGNINYPIAATYAFAIGAEVTGEATYRNRARELAHATLAYFSPNGLLFGEGHPQDGQSRHGNRPVDIGYNVEESLPALALYARITGDDRVKGIVVDALRSHLDFMLPDGGWDNSFGSRNYKWTWWGSRTSDGCHPAYRALADADPRFAHAADRNLALMEATTHDDLLAGGPQLVSRGYPICVHHSITHARALATVVDLGIGAPVSRTALPTDRPFGIKTRPEIGTHLVGVGPWRATFTTYDWDYLAPQGGGHATGGAMSLLFHEQLGPVCVSSLTRYRVVEPGNQQLPRDATHRCLTPRIEFGLAGETYTNISDRDGTLGIDATPLRVGLRAESRPCAPDGTPMPGDVRCIVTTNITAEAVAMAVEIVGIPDPRTTIELILPVVSPRTEPFEHRSRVVAILRPRGRLTFEADVDFEPVDAGRWFNLVPGFECLALRNKVQVRRPVHLLIKTS